jgi:hypothetical protein
VDGTGTEDQKRDEEWMPACRNCGLPIRESQQPQAKFGWTHTGDWEGVRCPGRVTGAVPDVRAAYRAGREDAARAGYAEAVARLRDDDRYRNWWSADGAWQHKPTGRYWDAPARKHLADYLETVGPDGPDVRTKPVDQPGVQPTEEQRAREEDQRRDEKEER